MTVLHTEASRTDSPGVMDVQEQHITTEEGVLLDHLATFGFEEDGFPDDSGEQQGSDSSAGGECPSAAGPTTGDATAKPGPTVPPLVPPAEEEAGGHGHQEQASREQQVPQRPEEEEGGAPSDSLLSELEIKAAKTRAERNLLVKLQAQLKKEDEEIEATRSTLSQDKAEIRALRAKLKPLEERVASNEQLIDQQCRGRAKTAHKTEAQTERFERAEQDERQLREEAEKVAQRLEEELKKYRRSLGGGLAIDGPPHKPAAAGSQGSNGAGAARKVAAKGVGGGGGATGKEGSSGRRRAGAEGKAHAKSAMTNNHHDEEDEDEENEEEEEANTDGEYSASAKPRKGGSKARCAGCSRVLEASMQLLLRKGGKQWCCSQACLETARERDQERRRAVGGEAKPVVAQLRSTLKRSGKHDDGQGGAEEEEVVKPADKKTKKKKRGSEHVAGPGPSAKRRSSPSDGLSAIRSPSDLPLEELLRKRKAGPMAGYLDHIQSKKLTDEVEIREVLFDIYQDPSSRFHRSLNDKLKQLLQ